MRKIPTPPEILRESMDGIRIYSYICRTVDSIAYRHTEQNIFKANTLKKSAIN